MPASLLTLLMFFVFFACGMLLGALGPKNKTMSILITLAFVVIIYLMGGIPLLIIFFVGLTVSSMMSERMQLLRRRHQKEVIKL